MKRVRSPSVSCRACGLGLCCATWRRWPQNCGTPGSDRRDGVDQESLTAANMPPGSNSTATTRWYRTRVTGRGTTTCLQSRCVSSYPSSPVSIVAKPDRVEQMRGLLLSLIAPSRAEDGCRSYELLHNLQDPTDFTVTEEWPSETHCAGHLASPHVQAALGPLAELGAKPLRFAGTNVWGIERLARLACISTARENPTFAAWGRSTRRRTRDSERTPRTACATPRSRRARTVDRARSPHD